jgi:hypothetical protein
MKPSPTPQTDLIIAYLKQQFPATYGHIPLRSMIGKLETDCIAARAETETVRAQRDELRKQKNTLVGHIIFLSDDAWPYLHQWCKIESIKFRWKRAREYINTI